jgi:hypothetical protein
MVAVVAVRLAPTAHESRLLARLLVQIMLMLVLLLVVTAELLPILEQAQRHVVVGCRARLVVLVLLVVRLARVRLRFRFRC